MRYFERAFLLRLLCHLLAALPLGYLLMLVARTLAGDFLALGADPAETTMSYLGTWGLRLLLVTLTVTPIQRTWPQLRLILYRRALGLWSFAYLAMHFSVYIIGINGFDWFGWLEDVVERRFILAGMLGWVLLFPLVVTSTRGWQARLGARWRQLHRLIYIIVLLGLLHFFLQVRSDYTEFVVVATIGAGLLGYRLYGWLRRARLKAGGKS